MISQFGENPAASSESKVLEALNSKYTCIHEPLPAVVDSACPDSNQRYLTFLRVFGNGEVEEPRSPLSASSSNTNPQRIKEKVTAALKALRFREPRVLVQFWSPVAVGKRLLLTTLDQPFGLGAIDEGLYSYRLESEQRMFVVDAEHREELGSIARVYRQKFPEWSLGINDISTRQSVQDWGAFHNIHGYINLPVFEPGSGGCVGVIELITSSNYVNYAFEVRQVSRALKEVNLKSPNVFEDTSLYARVGEEKRRHELDEIFRVLKMVCDIQNLPLAQTWGPCGYSSVVSNSGNLIKSCCSFNRNCIGKVCMSTTALPFYVRDLSKWEFHETCRSRHLDKSQGVVGRSLSSCGLCFCRDVSQLSEEEYPLAPYARIHGITTSLAIYLKGIEVDDDEYIVELFLPTQNENESDIQSLMKTVKQQIKNALRIQLGDISSAQVIGGIPINLNLESPTLNEKEEVQLEVPLDLENLHPFAENEKNEFDVEHMEEDKPLNSAAEVTNANVVVSYSGVGTEDVDIINKGKMIEKDFDYSKEPNRKKINIIKAITLNEDKPSDSVAAGTNQDPNDIASYLDVGTEDVDIINNKGKMIEKDVDNSKEPIRKKMRTIRSITLDEDKPSDSAPDAAETNENQNVVVPYSDVRIEDVDINTEKATENYIENSKKPTRKRKKPDRSISLEEIRKHFGKPMEEAADSLNVSRSTLKRICRNLGIPRWPYTRTPNETDPLLNPDQTDALTTLVLRTPNAPNTTHDPTTLAEHNNNLSAVVLRSNEQKNPIDERVNPQKTVKDKQVENIAENTFTIKVTYNMNTVKLLFNLSDGLEKLEKLVATRFQLNYGSFRLKYEDEDGDMILIACDNDLLASLYAFERPDVQTVIRLSVWPVTDDA